MALIVDGISPMEIIINGNKNINVFEVDGVGYWGKPHILNIDVGANTTVTVERTSSPYQNATLGIIETGSLVYYGDVLKISASANGDNVLATFTVNGEDWTNGSSITVSSSISIQTTAGDSKKWRTVWTGSLAFTYKASGFLLSYKDVSQTVSGVIANIPTKVSGVPYNGTNTFTDVELTEDKTFVVTDTDGMISVDQYILKPTENDTITANIKPLSALKAGGLVLKEVKQYY